MLHKELFELFKPFKKYQIFLCILISLQIILSAYIPFLIKNLIDTISTNNTYYNVMHLSGYIILLTLINVVLVRYQNYVWHKLRFKSINFLRGELFENALKKTIPYFENTNTAKIISLIMNDSSIVAQNIVIGLPMLICNIINIIVIIYVLFRLNIKLTIVILFSIPLYFISFNLVNKKIRKTSIDERENFDLVMKDIQEKIQGINTIKVFNIGKVMANNFKFILNTHFNILKKNLFYNNIGLSVNTLIVSMLPVIVLSIGSMLLIKKDISLGALIAFYTYVSNIYEPLSNLSDYNIGLQNSLAVGKRIIKFIDTDLEDTSEKIKIANINNIEFKNVFFGYSKNEFILKDFSLKIYKGDKVALIGKSGCGKSTIIKLLLGFYEPIKGEILINGISLDKIDKRSLYEILSLYEQNLFIFNSSLKNNIILDKDLDKKRLNDVLDVCNIENFHKEDNFLESDLSERGLNLSGGQKQRVCIGRSLYRNSDLIILDEPTSSLDIDSEELFKQKLEKYVKDKTLIIVSHKDTILEICDKIINLDDYLAINS